MANEPRLLHESMIPVALWDAGSGTMTMAGPLRAAYKAEIEKLGLLPLASGIDDDDSPVGGISKEASLKHFARRFAASCGRVALAVMDPKDALRHVSDRVINAFAGGKVALLDIPCGTGAGALSLLSTVAALRASRCLPAHPLVVHLLGGDISADAIEVARSMVDRIRGDLAEQSIIVRDEYQQWDVLDPASTVSLLNKWTSVGPVRMNFVLAANFSAFLKSPANMAKARPQLEQLFLWAGARASQVVWLEPQTKGASTFFGNVKETLKAGFAWLRFWRPETEHGPQALTDCIHVHPIDSSLKFPVRLALMLLHQKEPQ